MFFSRLIIPIIAILLLFTSCRKYNLTGDECKNFKEGIQANDKERVIKAVDHLLIEYSNKNLDKFAAALSSECNVSATVICYSCLDSYPPQSEIKVSFTESSGVIRSIMNVSYNKRHKMIIVAVHNY
jgi:hypothetical protein